MWVLALTVTASTGAISAWFLDRWRTRSRNRDGECGACGVSWSAAPSSDQYLIHGRLVCEECALRAKRRLPWELGALAVWAALLTAVAVGNLLSGNAVAIAVLAITGSAIVVPLGAVEAMKLANQRAQERIAAGEPPGLSALEGEVDGEGGMT